MNIIEHEVVQRPGYEALVIRICTEDLTLSGAIMDVKTAIFSLLSKREYPVVVVDFTRVKRTTTDGFAMLLGIQKRLKENHSVVCVVGLNQALEVSYKLCMMHRIMPHSESVEEALKGYEKEASANEPA